MAEKVLIEFPQGTKEECFALFAHRLRFPDYFGHNWDAFEECINDLSWLHHTPEMTVITSHRALPSKDQEIFEDILLKAGIKVTFTA